MRNHQKVERKYLRTPTVPLKIDRDKTVGGLLAKMSRISFQGRSLAQAFEVWQQMLADDAVIFMGMAGAMVPAGMRRLVAYLIKNRFIDCLVTTGANLFHDLHETLGRKHYMGSPHVNDEELQELMIDRMYDTYASEREFREADEFVGKFAASLDSSRPYTTREFLYLLGREVAGRAKEEGILTSAYRARIPIYCPAIVDSSYGIAIAANRYLEGNSFTFDLVQDVVETAQIASAHDTTGVVIFGGGTPKNFIHQTEVTASLVRANVSGHKYALQVITDPEYWGGLSGCTFEEAQSWGKIAKKASRATVHCDSTIALPILVTALSQKALKLARRRKKPKFTMGRSLGISM